MHRFSEGNSATLTSGGANFQFNDLTTTRTYGEVGAMLNVFDLTSKWSGFGLAITNKVKS